MKALVTGGSGFIGSHIVDKLVENGIKVRILDTKVPYRDDVEFYKGSILHSKDVSRCVRDVDVIYHIAAFSNIDLVKANPVKTVELNIFGTVMLLEAARKYGIKRFIFASSVFVYGNKGHIYRTAKVSSEMLCKDYHTLYGLPYTVLRFSTIYGPRSRNADIISIFVQKALNGEDLIIRGDGMQRRNFIYVEDVAEGSIQALKRDAEAKTFVLASPHSISINELANLVRNIFGNNMKIVYQGERECDYEGEITDIETTQKELVWSPRVSLNEGIARYASWYKHNKTH